MTTRSTSALGLLIRPLRTLYVERRDTYTVRWTCQLCGYEWQETLATDRQVVNGANTLFFLVKHLKGHLAA